jgi:hypothetical protein
MRPVITFIIIVAMSCIAVVANADLEQYSEDLHAKARTTDPDQLVQGSVQNALQANCNINDALRNGLSGENKGFADAMRDAEGKLKAVADKLTPVAKEGRFTRVVFQTPKQFSLPGGPSIIIRNGNDILLAIATLAQRSADAIARIRNGTGREEDFAEVTKNSAVISQLILQFYGITS